VPASPSIPAPDLTAAPGEAPRPAAAAKPDSTGEYYSDHPDRQSSQYYSGQSSS
jgi:hypothetical protein